MPVLDKHYNFQGEVEHLHQFLQTKNVSKAHVVGQSIRDEGLGSMPVLLYWDTDDPSAILKGGSGAVDMKGGLALFDLLAAKSKNVRMLISKGGGHFPEG